MDLEELSSRLIYVPAAIRIPPELWIDIAITLRDLRPLPHIEVPSESWDRRCYRNGHHSSTFCFAEAIPRLRHLSSACRFLHTLLEPFLYNTVIINGSIPLQAHSIIHTLTHRSDLLVHTRAILISSSSGLNADDTAALDLLLPRFHRLEHINLFRLVITPQIAQVLVDATHLRGLHLHGCRWTNDVPADWSKGRFGGQLTDLSLLSGTMFDVKPIPDTSKFEQLFVPTITKLGIDAHFVSDHEISWTSSLTRLASLSVGLMSEVPGSTLSRLLPLLPSVEDLRVDAFDTDKDSTHIADYLPRLRSFTGSLNLAQLLAGSRSEIESLHIQSIHRIGSGIDKSMEDDAMPFPALKKLVVERMYCDEDTLGSLAGQYPLLTHLVLETPGTLIEGRYRAVDRWLPTAPGLMLDMDYRRERGFPMSQRDYRVTETRLAMERELLEEIKLHHCHSLREARVSHDISWSYMPSDGWNIVRRQFINESL